MITFGIRYVVSLVIPAARISHEQAYRDRWYAPQLPVAKIARPLRRWLHPLPHGPHACRMIIDTRSSRRRLITGLLLCSLSVSLPAQNTPAYTLHAQSNLTLIDLTAVDRDTLVPDRTLTREDLQIFDNGNPVPTKNLDQGSGSAFRPVLLWLITQCNMNHWTEEGSGFIAGNAAALKKGMTHLHANEMVAVAHWCDSGEVGVDLRPSLDHDAALPAIDAVLRPVFTKPSDTRPGELALQAMIRQTQEVSRQAPPNFIPVLLFLHGDQTGAPASEIEKLLEETLQSSSMLFLLNDGAIQSRGGTFLGIERSHMLRYLAEQTGGAAIVADSHNPDSYSEALATILDRLHDRYQIGFVPQKLDGKVHKLKVQLTPEAKKSHPRLLLKARAEYRATSPPDPR